MHSVANWIPSAVLLLVHLIRTFCAAVLKITVITSGIGDLWTFVYKDINSLFFLFPLFFFLSYILFYTVVADSDSMSFGIWFYWLSCDARSICKGLFGSSEDSMQTNRAGKMQNLSPGIGVSMGIWTPLSGCRWAGIPPCAGGLQLCCHLKVATEERWSSGCSRGNFDVVVTGEVRASYNIASLFSRWFLPRWAEWDIWGY